MAQYESCESAGENQGSTSSSSSPSEVICHRLLFYRNLARSQLLRSRSNKERLQNEISLAFNTVTQRDARVSVDVGRATQADGAAMKTIAFTTLTFLPATFVCAVFSMPFFNFAPPEGSGRRISDDFGIYWAFALPLTFCTTAAWYVWHRFFYQPLPVGGTAAESPTVATTAWDVGLGARQRRAPYHHADRDGHRGIDLDHLAPAGPPHTGADLADDCQRHDNDLHGLGSRRICHGLRLGIQGRLVHPFCLPKQGSLLNPGSTYYITWEPTPFGADPNGTVQDQANYENYANSPGWGTTEETRAERDFYVWTVPEDLLASRNQSPFNVTFYLNFQEDNSPAFSEIRADGPTVTITREKMLLDDGLPRASPFPMAGVFVPLIFVAIILALLGFCLWGYRKRGVIPGAAAIGKLKRRSKASGGGGQGYGICRSRTERTGESHHQQNAAAVGNRLPDDKFPGSGIQLTDHDSSSPTSPNSGRNVFREEFQGQETGRQ